MRQQFLEATGGLRREPLEDVFEVEIGIVAVELGRLDQAHDDGSSLTSTQRAGEEPVGPAEGDRADSVLDVVVVDRQIAVFKIAR